MVNTQALKNRMEQLNVKQNYLAHKLNISQPALSQKLRNERSLNLDEMFCLAHELEIQATDLQYYFYAHNLQNASINKYI